MRGPLRLIVAATTLATGVLIAGQVATVAGAADNTEPTAVIRSVDTTAYPQVSVIVQHNLPSNTGGNVTVNGVTADGIAAAALADSGAKVGVVYVLDTTKAAGLDGAMDRTIDAVGSAIATKPVNQEVAIVAYGATSRVVSRFTTDPNAAIAALGTVQAGDREQAATNDGIALALELLEERPELQKNVVLVSASSDTGSKVSFMSLRGTIIENGVSISAVTLAADGVDHGQTGGLASDSQGQWYQVNEPADIAEAVTAAASWNSNQLVLQFTGPPDAGAIDISVAVGAATATASVVPGAIVSGQAVQPPTAEPTASAGPSVLRTDNGKYLGLALAMGATVLFAVGLGLLFTRNDNKLDVVLQAYANEGRTVEEDVGGNGNLVETRLLARAVELTSEIAQRRGVLTWLEKQLELADLPLRAGEGLFFYLAAIFFVAAAVLVLTANLIFVLAAAAIVGLIPPMVLKTLAARRRAKFVAQLPDMLQLLSSTLKAGYSLMQGVEAVSHEVQDPMGKELRRIVVESRLGRPLEESMNESADRMASPDFAWAVMAIGIQREVGGNLSELLLTVAETMTERERLRRDVKALTAEGRISAIVLGILPFGLGVAMYVINPEYIKTLFNKSIGQVLMGIAFTLMLGGFWWMKKTVEVDI